MDASLLSLIKELRELNEKVESAFTQTTERKKLNVQEDPWDNYLMHDSKYFIKLLAHQVGRDH